MFALLFILALACFALFFYANHLLIDVGNTSKCGMESVPPLKGGFKMGSNHFIFF